MKAYSRMWKDDVYALHRALRLPQQQRCSNDLVVNLVEALCLCFRPLAYPCRYGDIDARFPRLLPQISMIFNLVIGDLFDRYIHLLMFFNRPGSLSMTSNCLLVSFMPRLLLLMIAGAV